MPDERELLRAAIAGLEAQRASLGDAVVDAALGPLRAAMARQPEPEPEPGPQPRAPALRQVALLFLDVVGSTALARTLDPEDVADVLDGLLARATALVRAQGGRVIVFAGDGLLAAFGADEAREDDTERAVRCGLALLEAGRATAAAVRARHGWDGFDVRVGIHTGPVLLGGGVDGDGTIRGDAVNIAARMEQTAPPGALRISRDAYHLVRGVFDVAPQPPVAVKGAAEPVQTYLVERAKPRAFRVARRGIEGVETRMIGRDAELAALQAAFRDLFARPGLRAVSVVGEAGLGKSRLLYEFSNWAEARPERFVIFQGRATPRTPDQPYGLLRDILAWRFRLADDDGRAAAKAKLEQGLLPLFQEADEGREDAEAHAHLLGYLIGLDYADSPHVAGIRDDQRQIRNRAFHAAAEMFRRITVQTGLPAVLELEDLHWADEPSLEFLLYLGQVARAVPLLIVGLTRPSLFERRAAWIEVADHRRITLAPFGPGISRALAGELLKKLPEVPSALRELVSGGAEGNPFYMEELVKMLIDRRAIDASADVWAVDAGRLLATHVPPTLTGVLQARLDGLPAAERRALQEASVIGVVFWDQALAALEPASPATLEALARRELALPRADAALAGMREYAFKHQILHQVTYETVLKRVRRPLHARAAAWFAGLSDARAAEFLAVAAGHYAAAGEDGAACEYFARAAAYAQARSANDAVLDLVGRALALMDRGADPAGAALRFRLLDARERTLDVQGRRDEQAADLDALEALADAMDADALRAEIAWRRAHRAQRMGDFRAVAAEARRGAAHAAAAGDATRRLKAERLVANATAMLGDVPAARAMAEAGLAEARARGLREVEATLLNTLALFAAMAGDVAGNLAFSERCLRMVQAIGDRRLEMVALSNLAVIRTRMGEAERGAAAAEATLALTRALGDRVFEGFALNLLSDAAMLLGRDAQALAQADAAVAIAVATQARDKELGALLSRGEAELALGRLDAADASFARAAALADTMPGFEVEPRVGRARTALARGDAAAAVAHLQPMLADVIAGRTPAAADQPHLLRLACWQALDAAGDPRAPGVLAYAHATLRATAAAITDASLRESFLERVPASRAILSAWQRARLPR